MQVTMISFEHNSVEVAMPAMEVWTVFCQEIKDRIIAAKTVSLKFYGSKSVTKPPTPKHRPPNISLY